MSKPPSLVTFTDVDRVLRAAISAEGATFHALSAAGLPTPGAGVNWLQRARQYRKLLRERDALLTGGIGRSEFDNLTLTRGCACTKGCEAPLACQGHIITIRVENEIRGHLTTLSGDPIEVPDSPIPEPDPRTDPLLFEAMEARRALGLGPLDPEEAE